MNVPPLALGRGITKKKIRRYDDDLPQWNNKRIVREIIKIQAAVDRLRKRIEDE